MASTPWLPHDLLLEILVRSDPVTIVRGGATCKLLRLHVRAPGFRRRLLQRPADDRFLVGLFYRHAVENEVRASPLISAANSPSHRPPIPAASLLSRISDLFASHRLVASSDGLLVFTISHARFFGFREPERHNQVCVCNPATGERASFPAPATVSGELYVLLRLEDDDGRRAVGRLPSFRLLAADEPPLSTQTFSSIGGGWRPLTTRSPELPDLHGQAQRVQQFAVVLRGVAYWLYRRLGTRAYHVLALDVCTGQATSIDVPQAACIRRQNALHDFRNLMVAAVDGELSLIVAESPAISVWKVTDGDATGCWVRSVLIQTDVILRSVEPLLPRLACQSVELQWFGHRSGSIVFQMHGVGLLVLNLRSKRVYQLEKASKLVPFHLFCPYELDTIDCL